MPARWIEQDARDLIVRAIAALYLNAQSAAARVDAAQSRVTDSNTLLKLAQDKHDAGTATGVDVLRAQVQLANDKQALLVAQNQFKQSLLALARNLGMSPGTPLELAEPLRYQALPQPQPETLASAACSSPRRLPCRLPASARAWSSSSAPAVPATIRSSASTATIGEIGRSIGSVADHRPDSGPDRFHGLRSRPQRRSAGTCQPRQAHRRSDRRSATRHRSGHSRGAAESGLRGRAGRRLPGKGRIWRSANSSWRRIVFRPARPTTLKWSPRRMSWPAREENYILAVSSHVDAKFALARAVGDTEKNILQFMGNP